MTSLLVANDLRIEARLSVCHLEVRAAELVAVIGPNGAGKTSLLRALAGIELDSGDVRIGGEAVAQAPPARRMRLLSFLPATRALVWPISARDVISLGLPQASAGRLAELLDLLELAAIADRPVNHLSTGERSRVLLARSLAAQPKVLLLDEPLSNLDPYWVLRTLEILRETAADDCAVIASLHDLAQLEAFDRVLLVDRGQIIADRAPGAMTSSGELRDVFRIERNGDAWRAAPPLSRAAGPRSSP